MPLPFPKPSIQAKKKHLGGDAVAVHPSPFCAEVTETLPPVSLCNAFGFPVTYWASNFHFKSTLLVKCSVVSSKIKQNLIRVKGGGGN